jgi:hypothetical protein
MAGGGRFYGCAPGQEGHLWKQWRQAPGFFQRFTGAISADGNTISASWEKSSDGSTWQHDFNLTYKSKN